MGADRVERRGRRFSRRKILIESQIESMNFIGGEWVPADSGETSEIVNPSNPSEVLGTTPKSDKAETERAVGAASEALPDWKATLPPALRAARSEPHLHKGAPRDRRPHNTVELPAGYTLVEDGAGPDLRQHHRDEACKQRLPERSSPRQDTRRGRPARRSPEPGNGSRGSGRRGSRYRPARQGSLFHGLYERGP